MVHKQTSIHWDDLGVFLVLAEHGSVRGAARALGVSHSTVLRRLATLEAEIGGRLFERKVDGYEVTAAGQDVLDTARDLEETIAALERRVQGRDLRLAGPLRVTLPDPLLLALLPMCKEFTEKYPEIELTISVATGYVDMARREADVALRVVENPPPELVGRRVVNVACGIYAAKSYLRRCSTENLSELDWVTWNKGANMVFANWIEQNIPPDRIAIRLDRPWAIRDAVEAGSGLTVLPCSACEVRPTLRLVRLLPELSAPLWVLTHRDLRASARVRAFRDHLAQRLVEQRQLFEGPGDAPEARSPARPSKTKQKISR